jgi:hypothetical protein
MTTDPIDNTAAIAAAARADEAPAATPAAKPKRDRSKRNTGNPPGRPPKATTAAAADTAPRGRPSVTTMRQRQYTRSLARAGAFLFAINRADGLVFIEAIPRTAKALAEVAEQNPAIGKVLDFGIKSGAWIELGAALGAMGVPIAINHGKLPPIIGVLMSGDLDALRDAAAAEPAPVVAPAAEPAPVPPSAFVTVPVVAPAETGPGLIESFAVAPGGA